MDLLLGQLVYTSFPGIGCSSLASAQVPTVIQRIFIQSIVSRYWDAYNPPPSGYRAVFLHQVTLEECLFGWMYNDGVDDIGHTHVPYFICYYLASPLQSAQLENIFTLLHKGPVKLSDRQPPSALETIVAPKWNYQPARPGVPIPSVVHACSHIALERGELLDLFVPVDKQEMGTALNAKNYEQQALDFSIDNRYRIETIETGAVELVDEDIKPLEARIPRQLKAILPQEFAAGTIKRQPVKPLNEAVVINAVHTRSSIRTVSPQILSTRQTLNVSTHYHSVLAYRNSQLLLKVAIAATILALVGSIYGLVQTSIFAPNKPESLSSASSPNLYKK